MRSTELLKVQNVRIKIHFIQFKSLIVKLFKKYFYAGPEFRSCQSTPTLLELHFCSM